ncbi:PH domain-containing protein [Sphingomonas montana]|uniref:PH domain-containing protein n=1 Tax=Sphingomonas montana TaxID=1843236 RepID=UPI00096F29E5|nr:PH domain-containing protein [Sphingomonas montana]
MGLFSAHEITPGEITAKFGAILIEGETVLKAFKTVRDTAFFTTHRFVLVDVQGITGSKVDVQSVPYRSIVRFSVETAGSLDLDADLKIWVSSAALPLAMKVSRNSDTVAIQRLLAEKVLRA